MHTCGLCMLLQLRKYCTHIIQFVMNSMYYVVCTKQYCRSNHAIFLQITDDFLTLVSSKMHEATGEVPGFKELLYLAGLEVVGQICLDTRMGFLEEDGRMSPRTRLILDSVRGYQTASNRAMYGVPTWKWMPEWYARTSTKQTVFTCVLM